MWKRLSRIQLVSLDRSKALQKICMMMVHLSSISQDVEEVTGKKPIPFSQFAKDYTSAFT